MIERWQTPRRFVLWLKDRQGNITCDPIIYTNAAAAITAGESQVEKGTARDYNYSVVPCPQIGGEEAQIKLLTPGTDLARVAL